MKLTVAIPTFNRNDILKKNLPFLLNQLSDDCKLIIIDNCSKQRVDETIHQLIQSHPSINYEYVRNSVNIGGNANILRCFEMCQTEWLWILGDDDIPEHNAVETIFDTIARSSSDLANINFYCPDPFHPVREKDIFTKGLDDYLSKVDALAPSIFISSNIYRASLVKKNLSIAMFYQYSCSPQWIILLMTLIHGKECLISSKTIVQNGSKDTPQEDIASPIPIANGLPVLLTLPISFGSKRLLKNIIVRASKQWITAERILLALLIEASKGANTANVLQKYSFIKKFFLNLNSNPFRRIQYGAYGLLLYNSNLTLSITKRILKITRSKYKIPDVVRKQNEPID